MKISIGITMALIGFLILFLSFMSKTSSMAEKVIITIISSIIIIFGVFIEKGFFPNLLQEFDEEQKF